MDVCKMQGRESQRYLHNNENRKRSQLLPKHFLFPFHIKFYIQIRFYFHIGFHFHIGFYTQIGFQWKSKALKNIAQPKRYGFYCIATCMPSFLNREYSWCHESHEATQYYAGFEVLDDPNWKGFKILMVVVL